MFITVQNFIAFYRSWHSILTHQEKLKIKKNSSFSRKWRISDTRSSSIGFVDTIGIILTESSVTPKHRVLLWIWWKRDLRCIFSLKRPEFFRFTDIFALKVFDLHNNARWEMIGTVSPLNLQIKRTFTFVLKAEQSLINYTDEEGSFENFPVSFVPNGTF